MDGEPIRKPPTINDLKLSVSDISGTVEEQTKRRKSLCCCCR